MICGDLRQTTGSHFEPREGDIVEGKLLLHCGHRFQIADLKGRDSCPVDGSSLGEKVIERITEQSSTIEKIFNVTSEMLGVRVWGEIAMRGLPPMA
ncbi:MAG: hypothetical protein WAM28_02865 [Chlamydiales bacterium]